MWKRVALCDNSIARCGFCQKDVAVPGRKSSLSVQCGQCGCRGQIVHYRVPPGLAWGPMLEPILRAWAVDWWIPWYRRSRVQRNWQRYVEQREG